MSSVEHVKRTIQTLLGFNTRELGHKIITPNDRTVILYDVVEWDETMHGWIRQKIPGCSIHVISMKESLSGFAIVFRINPPRRALLHSFVNASLLLVLCVSGYYVFAHVNKLTIPQQNSLYDTQKKQGDPLKTTQHTYHHEYTQASNKRDVYRETTPRQTPGKNENQNNKDKCTEPSDLPHRSDAPTAEPPAVAPLLAGFPPSVVAGTIASAWVAPVLESWMSSFFPESPTTLQASDDSNIANSNIANSKKERDF
jgi:hypothetical protein